jgi:hypothetical protein
VSDRSHPAGGRTAGDLGSNDRGNAERPRRENVVSRTVWPVSPDQPWKPNHSLNDSADDALAPLILAANGYSQAAARAAAKELESKLWGLATTWHVQAENRQRLRLRLDNVTDARLSHRLRRALRRALELDPNYDPWPPESDPAA